MNLTIFFCIYVLLLYFSFKHICLFWDLCYIDLFDSYVRFFFFFVHVHFLEFSSIEKGKSFEILCCAVPLARYIDLIFEI